MILIPNVLGAECKSNAERKVFRFLMESSLSGFAFHSVGLPEHEKKSYSEADFIVVSPYGVLCLEVKGGRVDCQNGVWEFENRYGKKDYKNEGPFDQAAGALFALRTKLKETMPWVQDISFATGVVFTDIIFNYRGVSVIPEIMYDYSSVEPFDFYIKQCHDYWDRHNRKTYQNLSKEEMEELKRAIRDDLHFVPCMGSIIDGVDEQLVRLTEEQISVLGTIEENNKVLVNGPAGSGKTLIAMQYARNCAAQGKNVLFLTYNKVLANYLYVTNKNSLIEIKHFHGLISDYVPLDSRRLKDPNYYNNILPEQFLKYLSTRKILAYDVLIIDEGQDLLNTKYFPIFETLLRKGLYNGTWMCFYDGNQNLFNQAKFSKALDELQKYNPIKCKLTKNCRNTEPIALYTKYLSGIPTGKAIVSGDTVDMRRFNNGEFANSFETLLDYLRGSNVRLEDISILSPRIFSNSILSEYIGKYSSLIYCFNGKKEVGKIRFASIQSFKGLDSKVVIALDIDELDISDKNIVLYTLLSRARTMLYLFARDEKAKEIDMKVLLGMSTGE